ncbi:hypothetical protein SODALDRAFT_147374 [Sodiomyces alkalinus F11]|uniref:Uncharacterized protein n=1 Tax=Sodiomyces alkalinus (strain CBS 110278 / VKM F-3762 / F11) TaxID=1314773 RepID=A0A3N2PWI8_SODAK|nr:hypothetical protein SODALDRAFT_147374 [Sodiomyces alkalinus F11]ROT38883.1 hypothetical protein SODALDRAFT_147374 [Sodiomyces alkalinus F11]
MDRTLPSFSLISLLLPIIHSPVVRIRTLLRSSPSILLQRPSLPIIFYITKHPDMGNDCSREQSSSILFFFAKPDTPG